MISSVSEEGVQKILSGSTIFIFIVFFQKTIGDIFLQVYS